VESEKTKKKEKAKMNRIVVPFALPLGFKKLEYKSWRVSGYYEFDFAGVLHRHYCIERKGKGFSAVLKKSMGKWRGIRVSDQLYYAKGMSAQKLAALMKVRKPRKKRKR